MNVARGINKNSISMMNVARGINKAKVVHKYTRYISERIIYIPNAVHLPCNGQIRKKFITNKLHILGIENTTTCFGCCL